MVHHQRRRHPRLGGDPPHRGRPDSLTPDDVDGDTHDTVASYGGDDRG